MILGLYRYPQDVLPSSLQYMLEGQAMVLSHYHCGSSSWRQRYHSERQTRKQITGFARISIIAVNSSHFLWANKETRFKIVLTSYGIVHS
jgi:hypothetical protein